MYLAWENVSSEESCSDNKMMELIKMSVNFITLIVKSYLYYYYFFNDDNNKMG